jgi:hypothetical protein
LRKDPKGTAGGLLATVGAVPGPLPTRYTHQGGLHELAYLLAREHVREHIAEAGVDMNAYRALVLEERANLPHAHVVAQEFLAERLDGEAAGRGARFDRSDGTHAPFGLAEIGVGQAARILDRNGGIFPQAQPMPFTFFLVPTLGHAPFAEDP